MLFRLVTIIYFTILCHSLTLTSFVLDEILDQHSSANFFGQSPPAGHMRVWEQPAREEKSSILHAGFNCWLCTLKG